MIDRRNALLLLDWDIGLPTAALLASNGYSVNGMDINDRC